MTSVPKESHGHKQGENSLEFFPFRSLYGVLDSMQGLRQVIQGVSVDEIIEANEKAKQLIQRLSSLQTGLANLDATKQFLAKVKETVASESAENRVELQSSLPNLDAIKNILGKLREAPLEPTLTESTENRIDLPASLTNLDATKQFLAKVKEIIASEPAEKQIESKKDISKKHSQSQSTKAPSKLIHFPGPSKSTREEARTPSQDTPLEKALALAENHLVVENRTPKANADQATVDIERPSATIVTDFTLGERQLGDEKFELGFSLTHVGETEKSSLRKDIHSARPSAKIEHIPASSSSRKDGDPTKLEISFDQDLLNNLIKDYGEFTIYTKLSAEPRRETNFIPNQTETAAQLFQQATPKSGLADDHNPSWQRKEGDLDKKLKKLMKDYGKIDKYSPNSSNIKKTAVAIFVLVIISVIAAYFFTSRQITQLPIKTDAKTTQMIAPSEPLSSSVAPTPPITTTQADKKTPKLSKPAGQKESATLKEE